MMSWSTTKSWLVGFVVAFLVSLVLLYLATALAMLRHVTCDGQFSLLHPNPHCRAPKALSIAALISLATTAFVGLAALRAYRLKVRSGKGDREK